MGTRTTAGKTPKREKRMPTKNFSQLPQTDRRHEHPGDKTTRTQDLRQLLNHRRKIRDAIQTTEVRKDRIERRALNLIQLCEGTLLKRNFLAEIVLRYFFWQLLQHAGCIIGGMHGVTALRQLNCINAGATIQLKEM